MSILTAIKNWWSAPSCCEVNGVANCQQGRTCPVREGTHKPAGALMEIQEPPDEFAEIIQEHWDALPARCKPRESMTEQEKKELTDYLKRSHRIPLLHYDNFQNHQATPFRCHDADACALGQKPCPMPGACGIQSQPK